MARTTATQPASAHPREIDWLLLSVVVLCCLGLLMAISVQGAAPGVSTLQAIKGHGSKLAIGFVAFLACAVVPMSLVRANALKVFGVACALVYAAAVFGRPVKGACRWIEFGGAQFQPVELARLGLIAVTALLIATAGEQIRSFKEGLLITIIPCALLVVGLVIQPDNGNALQCLALVALMCIVGGVSLRYFAMAGVPLLGVVLAVIATKPYVQDRLRGFLNVEPGSQVAQSLVAIRSGGLTGRGLGESWMKMGFVPEAQNDFVFAIVGEELGLLGTLTVVALFVVIGVSGMRLVLRCRDEFCRMVVLGLTLAICMQATINLLVVTGMAPPKGIDLPFVSSGGTNLVSCLAAVGLIGNAARADARLSWEG